MQNQLGIEAFFDEQTFTLTYLVYDKSTNTGIIIDPVLNYAPASGRTTTKSADEVLAFANDQGISVAYIMETHAHADHISGAQYLKEKTGAKIGIGAKITHTQSIFADIFNLKSSLSQDGSQFDVLLNDGDTIAFGNLSIKAMHTPGHTPACMCYIVEDAIFVGDTLFMPDFGTARADFPGGDAGTLYDSIHKILSLPDNTRIFTGHDYMPGGRDLAYESSVAQQKADNVHVGNDTSKQDFIAMRTQRDAQLSAPNLILPSIQLNINAGKLPQAEDNDVQYLKIPLNKI